VNGTAVISGTASASVSLAVGTNNIIVVVTAQDGTTTQTYITTVGRGSNNASLSVLSLSTGSLTPVSGTNNFTASVSGTVTSAKVTPTTADPSAKVTVALNGGAAAAVTSGTASASLALNLGANTITTVVTAQDGVTTKTYIITVTRVPSNNASLTAITLTPASTLTNTGTVGTITTYTTSVSGATASVKVTPTVQDPTATVTVNGIAVASGTASGSIGLAAGANTINTVVTAQDGTTTRTYSIVVTRPVSSPVIAYTTPDIYTVGVAIASSAPVNTGGTPTSYSISPALPAGLVFSTTTGIISGTPTVVTAATNFIVSATNTGGTGNTVLNITVKKAPSNNASLTSITLTPASSLVNTGTIGSTTTYTISVSNATTSVKVTPTVQDPTATVKVNGIAVTSGTASGSIALAVGQTTINTVVTAQDGVTTRTYSISVTRATGPLMSLYQSISVTKPTETVTIENDGVMVHQGVSPNGDGVNDVLTIDGITAYPDNHLTIIDRNGSLIFQAKGYDNSVKAFDGHSSTNGRMLQTGTYFYSLDYSVNGENKHKTGYVLLKY
jgi:gliding motility-associated-like protein